MGRFLNVSNMFYNLDQVKYVQDNATQHVLAIVWMHDPDPMEITGQQRLDLLAKLDIEYFLTLS